MKTPVANMIRCKPSGIYFARGRVRGKLFRQSLEADVVSVAKLRLGDFVRARQEEMRDAAAARSGKMTMADGEAKRAGGCTERPARILADRT